MHDEQHEVLVVNWQAPASRPFYTATPGNPQRVTLRRRFRTEGRRIVGHQRRGARRLRGRGASVSDFLLEELERRREGRMRDIVATIQSDQYRLITAEPDGALVVQGGPGTGKTAVGLHRASWLLFTHREQLRRRARRRPEPDVHGVRLARAAGARRGRGRAARGLGALDGIEVGREEAPDVARLKADTRLGEVVRRAVESRSKPAPEELVLYADGSFVSVREREVTALLDERASRVSRSGRRASASAWRLRRFYEHYGELLGRWRYAASTRSSGRLGARLPNEYLDRVLALPHADKLVARLLTSPAALAEAAEGILDADEQSSCSASGRAGSERGASTTCHCSTRRGSAGRRARSGT